LTTFGLQCAYMRLYETGATMTDLFWLCGILVVWCATIVYMYKKVSDNDKKNTPYD